MNLLSLQIRASVVRALLSMVFATHRVRVRVSDRVRVSVRDRVR